MPRNEREILTEKIDQWVGGMADSGRAHGTGSFETNENLDIFLDTNLLTPKQDLTNGISDETYGTENLIYDGESGAMWGLGYVAGTEKLKIRKVASPPFGAWSEPANAECTNNTASSYKTKLFIVHRQRSGGGGYGTYLYLKADDDSSSAIARFGDVGGTPSITASWQTVNGGVGSRVPCNGIIGPDNLLYIPYQENNKDTLGLSSYNGATNTWTTRALVLDNRYEIVQLAKWKNYLAIGCKPIDLSEQSVIMLWDCVSADVNEIVPIPSGQLGGLANLEGALVAICNTARTSANTGSLARISWSIYNGGAVQKIKEIVSNNRLGYIDTEAVVRDNKVYIGLRLGAGTGSTEPGIFAFGRKDSSKPFALSREYYTVSGLAPTQFLHIFFYDDILFASARDGSGNSLIVQQASSGAYAAAYLQTLKYDCGTGGRKKKLHGIRAYFPKINSGGQGTVESVTIKYKVDDATSWTTLGSTSTTGDTALELNKESDGTQLQDFYEIQFRVDLAGGARFRGLEFDYEVLTSGV